MKHLEALRREMNARPDTSGRLMRDVYMARGYAAHMDDENAIARAYAIESLFEDCPKRVYESDLILGSMADMVAFEGEYDEAGYKWARSIVSSYGERTFITNSDHYAPDYETFLREGVDGTLERIARSMKAHEDDHDAQIFLESAAIAMRAFSRFIEGFAAEARTKGLDQAAAVCERVAHAAPETFREALQLMWLVHTAFLCEGRYAMAIGRMDQFLYPYYKRDADAGRLTPDEACELVACTLYKIGERRLMGADDVVNIAIGGVTKTGENALNELSYIILHAVGACNIPGPNLSARIHSGIPEEFLDACLQVIGTGLGYPALMNDEVNIPALARHGYALEDARNYCMVGCIENFIQGMQPPWSDGRYNVPKYIELALNRGACMQTGVKMGPDTGDIASFETMDDFMRAFETQLRFGAAEYMMRFRNENERYDRKKYISPFLSCFCRDCIGRGRDINDGGAVYPSVHGAACMGIGTVADSLAAIEKLVYVDHRMTLEEMRDILAANFEGHGAERRLMLDAPKYGNGDDFVDKYAVWYVKKTDEIFSRYRTWDGGAIYTGIASNTSNIPAGREVAATPDGRENGEPMSDAASPMHGRDHAGPTAVVLSVTKPDYRLVSCGTVLNQKFSPSMFADEERRGRLRALIRAYFARGGQEMQINSVSRETLIDAMNHPAGYESMVVRVSGFSAYYTALGRDVQEDILKRTEHE